MENIVIYAINQIDLKEKFMKKAFLLLGLITLLALFIFIILVFYYPVGRIGDVLNKKIYGYLYNGMYESDLREFLNGDLSNPPEWFLKQIKDDFADISSNKITSKLINDTHEKLSAGNDEFIRIKIINHKIYYKSKEDESKAKELAGRYEIFLSALNEISERLPNSDFILYLGDIHYKSLQKDIAPIFVFSKSIHNKRNQILMPDSLTLKNWKTMQYSIEDINSKSDYDNKIPKAIWRGTTTGALYDSKDYFGTYTQIFDVNNYHKFQRTKAVSISQDNPDILDAKFVYIAQATKEAEKIMLEKYKFGNFMSKKEQLQYQIQLTIDGNSCTYPGYLWRLASNSVNIKVEGDDYQLFYGILKPWEHYVPAKYDLSDLAEQIKWVLENQDKAKEISSKAQELVKQNLMITDIYWYIVTLLEEYSKLVEMDDSLEGFREYKS